MNAGAHLLETSWSRSSAVEGGASAAATGAGAQPPRRRHRATPGVLRSHASLALALLPALLVACDPYVKGNGVLREESRSVAAFEGLRVEDGINAEVTAGAASQRVVVSGDENLLQHVQTTVRTDPFHGPVLEVRSSLSDFESTHPLRVVVSVPVFRFIAATDACYAAVTGVATEVMAVEADDGADLVLSGAGGDQLTLRLAGGKGGGAFLDARGYPAGVATVELVGGARAELRVEDRVSGTVSGPSTLENVGGGTCELTATPDATVTCP